MEDRVTRQLSALLASVFEPSPHPLSSTFRSFISIDQPSGTVSTSLGIVEEQLPVGGSAVVIPVALTQDPVGSPDSLSNVVLDGNDFAVAVSEEAIMGLLEAHVGEIKAFSQTYTVTLTLTIPDPIFGDHSVSVSTVYRASVSSATATWDPHGSFALIKEHATGRAHTDSVAPDVDFTVDQAFQLDFDQGNEQLRLTALTPGVSLSGALPQGVLNDIATKIRNAVKSRADAAVNDAQPALEKLAAGSGDLAKQLATIDDQVDAHFDDATFILSGLIMWGWISVADRRRPSVSFTRIDPDDISAFQSWIPGGRIDRLEWSWTWFNQSHDPGQASFSDRYVLQRLRGEQGRFRAFTGTPVPGLDGAGRVCLTVYGVAVDSATGDLVSARAGPVCVPYSVNEILAPDGVRLFLRELAGTPRAGSRPRSVEAGLVEVTTRGWPTGPGVNTLILYVDEGWSDDDARALVGGVDECRRSDAGLLVLVLFRDGWLTSSDALGSARLREVATSLGAPMLVNEDVHGGWSNAFLIPTGTGQPAWRLLTPNGGVVWAHDGPLAPKQLAEALDHGMYPSPLAWPLEMHAGLKQALFTPAGLGTLFDSLHPARRHCPPLGAIRPVDAPSVMSAVFFIRKNSPSSAEELRRLRAELDGRGDHPGVAIVVDGADSAEASRLHETLGQGITVVADPDGALAGSVGVRFWPTRVVIGDGGSSQERGTT
jgi:hypothetical protein